MGMTPETWARMKRLFAEASELPEAERRALLAREAGDDKELLAELESLLDWSDRPEPFAEAVPGALFADVFAPSSAHEGERLGAYRIEAQIGTGGMGDVYKAVRDDDQYHAEVAIKIMRADVWNPLAAQRFRTERQILAALDHRNIARLLDGGTTSTGLPYVVMELIEGEPIDAYCENCKLDTRERVQLFLQVCAAVAYAHQRLVVHRDLKPNNILVKKDGSVKLLDFGIAKLLENDSPTVPRANHTVTQLRAMTLDFASPEQVSGGAVTTVSDVYSLGVVLYWLLTGQSPYGAHANDAQRVAEILGDTTPPRPSVVRKKQASARGSDVDADLDSILLMALRKEPQKRYGTVDQFATDLRNYLAGRPVFARRSTLRYRFGKFARRHKVEIAASIAVFAALLGGLFFTLREARIAQRHFASVRTLANRLFDFHDEIARLPNATRAREMLVNTSLEYLDALNKESASDRSLQEELGIAYRRVGDLQGDPYAENTGDTKAALESYAKSIALLDPLYAEDRTNHRLGANLAQSYARQSRKLLFTEGYETARAPAAKAFTLAEAHQEGVADAFDRMKLLVDVSWVQGIALSSSGKNAEAMKMLDGTLPIAEAYARAHPGEARSYQALSEAYRNAIDFDDPKISAEEAAARIVKLAREMIAANEKLVALDPNQASYKWDLAEGRLRLGATLLEQKAFREAIEQYQLASPVLAARATDKTDAHARLRSLVSEAGLAWGLLNAGRAAEGEKALLAAERDLAQLAIQYDSLHVAYQLAQTRIRLGTMYSQRADAAGLARAAQLAHWEKARGFLEQGNAGIAKVAAAFPASPTDRPDSTAELGLQTLAKANGAIAKLSNPP